MTILLTGGTGFIGQHVLRLLLEGGYSVRAVVRPRTDTKNIKNENLEIMYRNLCDVSIEDIRGCDTLIHLAAYGVTDGMNNWSECFRVNVTESLALMLNCIDAGLRRFIICGSCFEYGQSGELYDFIPADAMLRPMGAYHASKASASIAAWALSVSKNIEMAILRPFHVYGEGESLGRLYPSLLEAAKTGRDFPMTEGNQIRDFVHVYDVACSIVSYVESDHLVAGVPVIKNLGSGKPVTVYDFCERIWRENNATGKLQRGIVPYRANEVMRFVPAIKDEVR